MTLNLDGEWCGQLADSFDRYMRWDLAQGHGHRSWLKTDSARRELYSELLDVAIRLAVTHSDATPGRLRLLQQAGQVEGRHDFRSLQAKAIRYWSGWPGLGDPEEGWAALSLTTNQRRVLIAAVSIAGDIRTAMAGR